ncbi:MAG: InlB B-repeat-containing protein [Actinomycetes bacterium]|nr:InlB B-repeat-containing protein [Actinomycetes bacterium]
MRKVMQIMVVGLAVILLCAFGATAYAAPSMTANDEASLAAAFAAPDCTQITLTADITLTSELTLDRTGVTLSSDTTTTRVIYSAPALRHIRVDGAPTGFADIQISFQDVMLDGGYNGGGILYLEPAKAVNAPASNQYVPDSSFTLTLTGASIIRCMNVTTAAAPADYIYAWYDNNFAGGANRVRTGAVGTTGSVSLVDCAFSGNRLPSGTFTTGSYGSAGAAVTAAGRVQAQSSAFENNSIVAAGGMYGMGGAIYAQNGMTLSGCSLTGNNACRGGALYANNCTDWNSDSSAYGVYITDCTLTGNYSNNWGSVYFSQDPVGGGESAPVIFRGDNVVSNNTSAYQTGAIHGTMCFVYGSMQAVGNAVTATGRAVTGAFFSGHPAAYKWFVADITGDSLFDGNVVTNGSNTANDTANGGVISVDAFGITVRSGATLTFRDNGRPANATNSTALGGALFAEANNRYSNYLYAEDGGHIVFDGNRTPGTYGYGGAIFVGQDAYSETSRGITIAGDVRFVDNTAMYGGAIYSEGGMRLGIGQFSATTAYYRNNLVVYNGDIYCLETAPNTSPYSVTGAFNAADWTLIGPAPTSGSPAYPSFASNSAGNRGGAAYVVGNTVIDGGTFTDNSAGTYGGGALIVSGNLSVSNATFARNTTTSYGGAIRQYNGTSVSIADSSFTENTAEIYGGAVYVEQATGVTRTLFDGNRALRGGGLYMPTVTGNAAATITVSDNTTFTANVAEASTTDSVGGAIAAFRALTVTGPVLFDGNTATFRGGAIYGGAQVTAKAATFTDNVATGTNSSNGYGGAIYAAAGVVTGDASANGSTFTNNRAAGGGAIVMSAAGNRIYSSTFTGNTAVAGGALYAMSGTAAGVVVYRSSFTDNVATGDCGAAIGPQYTSGGAIWTRYYLGLQVQQSVFADNAAPTYYAGALDPSWDTDPEAVYTDKAAYDFLVGPLGNTWKNTYTTLYNNGDINYAPPTSAATYYLKFYESRSLVETLSATYTYATGNAFPSWATTAAPLPATLFPAGPRAADPGRHFLGWQLIADDTGTIRDWYWANADTDVTNDRPVTFPAYFGAVGWSGNVRLAALYGWRIHYLMGDDSTHPATWTASADVPDNYSDYDGDSAADWWEWYAETSPTANPAYVLRGDATAGGAPTRAGYVFAGWKQQLPGGGAGTLHIGGDTLALSADATFVAQWQPIDLHVVYDANGGTGSVPGDTQNYLLDDIVTVQFTPQPTLVDYAFAGWSYSATATAADFIASGTTTFAISQDTTLYAVWNSNPRPRYHVVYDANGGTGSVPVDVGAYLAGDSCEVTYTPMPTRAGYSFVGWAYSSLAATADFATSTPASFTVTADTTLYAVWQANVQPPVNPPTTIDDGTDNTTDDPPYVPPRTVDTPKVTPPPADLKVDAGEAARFGIIGLIVLAGGIAVVTTRKRPK